MWTATRYVTAALAVNLFRIRAQDGLARGPKAWSSFVDLALRRIIGLPEQEREYD
jgi:hypothetical protein